MRAIPSFLFVILAASLTLPARACEWSDVDHKVALDTRGVWNPNVYRALHLSLTAAQLGDALWEGSASRWGRTLWQGLDSEATTQVAVEAMKRVFNRPRPAASNDSCEWFGRQGNHSFPSGEAASSMALVMPYVLEYGREDPATYAALLLPAYIGVARVRGQAHWQSDVIGGWLVGGLAGWYAHDRDVPLLVEILPKGITVGIQTRF